jgi:transcriptional regulator with XRE-family HTH domain
MGGIDMRFAERVRELRDESGLTQQELADRLGVSVSYISKVENERLHFGDYPSEKFIHKLATELDADEDELLLLTDRVPVSLRKRIRERPEAFMRFADLDDACMDALLSKLGVIKK